MSVIAVVRGSNGKISMLRVTILFIVAIILLVFLAQNISSMIKGGGFVSMGYQEVLILSVSLLAKVAQRYVEGERVLDSNPKE